MKNKLIIYLIEYLSLVLVLSFFLVHNIYLEFMGIGLALLSINKSIIKNKINLERILKDKKIKSCPKKDLTKNLLKIEEKSTLSLVESIEESGFIPSIDKDNNAA